MSRPTPTRPASPPARRLGRVTAAAVTVVLGAGLAVSAAPAHAATARPADPVDPTGEVLPGLDLAALQLPVLSGLPQLGSTLSVADPVWNLLGVVNKVQWLRDGLPIPGATGSTYVPTLDDAGHQVTALVTGTLLGLPLLSVLSNGLDLPLPTLPGTDPTNPGGGTDPVTTALQALFAPVLSGVPHAGSVLTAPTAVWNAAGVLTQVQWLRDGLPIPGATGPTYVPTLDDLGSQISALVTGRLDGVPALSVVTDALGISAQGSGAPQAKVAPVLSGLAKVGTTVLGKAPEWDTDGVTTTYQWLRNNTPITGATDLVYTLVGEDYGKALTLRATGTKDGVESLTTSSPVTGKLGEALGVTTSPRVAGKPKVGEVLTATTGSWTGTGTTKYAYQWLSGGQAVEGATSSTYVVKAADAARRLSVRVTATRLGYPTGTATSETVTVAKLASTAHLVLAKSRLGKGRAGIATIVLRSVGTTDVLPAGTVRLLDGRRVVATYAVAARDNGRRTVKLPVLRPGLHQLKVTYVGGTRHTGATSRAAGLRVLER